MKWPFRAAVIPALAWLAAGDAPAEISVEDFARSPLYAGMKLSADGASVGYLLWKDGDSGIGFLDVARMHATVMVWKQRMTRKNIVYDFDWIGPDRVVVYTAFGWAAINRDLSHPCFLTGSERWGDERNRGAVSPTIFNPWALMQPTGNQAGRVLVWNSTNLSTADCPDVLQLDTYTGAFHVVEKNPGNVKAWGADWDGHIRFGLLTDGVNTRLIYRAEPGVPWGPSVDFGTDTIGYSFAGLAADNHTLYVFKPSPNGRKALYAFDLKERQFGPPLFQHEKYDVDAAIFSPKHRRLLGVRYVTEGPRQYWFEPDFKELQKKIDTANPGLVNQIVSMDWDLKRMLVFSSSAREPGYYTLVEPATNRSLPLAKVRPWLNPADLADMYLVKCQARDGLEIDGYLTLPPGRGQRNLPLVTFVHGGPFGVRDVWGFDPIVQFLASRGYAVLQVNYRGSGGMGGEFYRRGRGEIGGAIQNDIEDLTRWAVTQGIADPRRLAVMGGSFGGYSALFALAHSPALFRCGIAFGAVSDWNALFKHLAGEGLEDSLRWWAVMTGGVRNAQNREHLAAVSPVNLAAQISAPLLIVHGDDDIRVPPDQARAMVAALKKTGHPPETLFLAGVGHWWPQDRPGVEFLKRVEAFLARNLVD